MTEAEWLEADDPQPLLDWLCETRREADTPAGRRRLRLFACACARQVIHLIPNPEAAEWLAIAERYADERATADELTAAAGERERAYDHFMAALQADGAMATGKVYAPMTAYLALRPALEAGFADDARALESVAEASRFAVGAWAWAYEATRTADSSPVRDHRHRLAAEAGRLRDIFGNPFRPVNFDPAWRTEAVVGLARAIDIERAYDRTPILADAMEDAGCNHVGLLDHLRGAGHVCGCWAVDLALGRA